MRFAYSQDEDDFRRAVRAFFETRIPHHELPLTVEQEELDRGLWGAMADQLDLQGLVIPEQYGGSGFGMVELALVLEESGRALLPGPFFASAVVATAVLLESQGDRARDECLSHLASGERLAALATRESADGLGGEACLTQAMPEGGGYRLSGAKTSVYGGAEADFLIVSADGEDGESLYLAEADGGGVVRHPLTVLDPTRGQAAVELNACPAVMLGRCREGRAILERALRRATIALAAEQVGGAQRCLEMAVEHAKERVQFGRAIGSFQAIKHRCADMLWDIEGARSAVWYAAWAFDAEADDLVAAVAVASASASEAYTRAARSCIQILGGIGFTWEHPAQLHLRRATSSETLVGPPGSQRERLAAEILNGQPADRRLVKA